MKDIGPVIAGLSLVAAVVAWAVWAIRRMKRRVREARLTYAAHRCVCGYDLQGIDIPRCPECGRAIGFDKSFEELGLSDAEVREHIARRRQELKDKPLSPEVQAAMRELDEMTRRLLRY